MPYKHGNNKLQEQKSIYAGGIKVKHPVSRRNFVKWGIAGAIGLSVNGISSSALPNDPKRTVRIGLIGIGGRGYTLLSTLMGMENLAFPAVCDIKPDRVAAARKMLAEHGHPQPEGYGRDEWAFTELTARDDLDAIIIATPWNWHTPMAISAMKAGKFVGVEVPAAITLKECWELVHTSEKYGVPCMMLENWSFRRDNLAVLKMIRAGLFGETVHAHCAYSHDAAAYFFNPDGTPTWRGKFLEQKNRDHYPTHSLGPVLSWMNINCGDRFDTLTSTATGSFGTNQYFRDKYGPDHPLAKRKIKQGDVVTTVVKTLNGKSIVIFNDMQLPRPYDNQWMIQGTEGIYDHKREALYLSGKSPQDHQWEPFAPYQEKYDHAWWKNTPSDIQNQGHGGCDYLVLREFVNAVRMKTPPPIDVYDSVTMSCIVPLSEASIAKNSAPVHCPDFMHGKWKTIKPHFALET